MQDKLIRKIFFLLGTASAICFIYLQISLSSLDFTLISDPNVVEMASVSPEVDLLKFCIEKFRYLITANFA